MRISVLMLILMAIIALGSDWLIFSDINSLSSNRKKKILKWIWWFTTIASWIILIILAFYPKRDPKVNIAPAMWMLYSWISIYIPKIAYTICSLLGRLFVKKNHSKPNRGISIGIVIAIIIFIGMWSGVLITRHRIIVNQIEITSANLPKSFDGFKVVQFSDIHVGTWGNDTTFISTMVDSINSLKPDIILFTGDIVNRQSSELIPFIPVLRRLKAPHGVHMVYGNHDYGGYVNWPDGISNNDDNAKLGQMVQSMGWKLYSNSNSFISNATDSIALIGVDNWGEPPFNKLGDLIKAYPNKNDSIHSLNDSNFKILMTHNPNHWVNVVRDKSNIDLTLSGHTHAMQAMIEIGNFKWSPSKFVYPNWGGLYSNSNPGKEHMQLYVNIGAGEVGFPARLGAAYPEITLFTLRSNK